MPDAAIPRLTGVRAGNAVGRDWAVPGAGLVSSGANERAARRGLGARAVPAPGGAVPASGAVPAPGGAGRGATEGSPWARRRQRTASLVPLPADLKEGRGDSAGIAGSPAIGEKTANHLTQEGWKGIRAGVVIIVLFRKNQASRPEDRNPRLSQWCCGTDTRHDSLWDGALRLSGTWATARSLPVVRHHSRQC